jgi:hypothetical protein
VLLAALVRLCAVALGCPVADKGGRPGSVAPVGSFPPSRVGTCPGRSSVPSMGASRPRHVRARKQASSRPVGSSQGQARQMFAMVDSSVCSARSESSTLCPRSTSPQNPYVGISVERSQQARAQRDRFSLCLPKQPTNTMHLRRGKRVRPQFRAASSFPRDFSD